MDKTNIHKTCPEYFGNGICAVNFLWCPHWVEEKGFYVPKGCEDKLCQECIHTNKEKQNDVP